MHDVFHWNDENNVEPTNITTTNYHASPSKGIYVYDPDYGNTGWAGYWSCIEWASGNTVCTWGQIQINLYNPTSHNTWYQDNSRWVLCQEMGQALGLDHDLTDPDTSCMENTYNSGEDLTSHDTAHINANYD